MFDFGRQQPQHGLRSRQAAAPTDDGRRNLQGNGNVAGCPALQEFQVPMMLAYPTTVTGDEEDVQEESEPTITDEYLDSLAQSFLEVFNDLNDRDDNDDVCDPFFRRLTDVQVSSTDVNTLSGTNDGEFVKNPLPIMPLRQRGLQQQQNPNRPPPLLPEGDVAQPPPGGFLLPPPPPPGLSVPTTPTESIINRTSTSASTLDLILFTITGTCRSCLRGIHVMVVPPHSSTTPPMPS